MAIIFLSLRHLQRRSSCITLGPSQIICINSIFAFVTLKKFLSEYCEQKNRSEECKQKSIEIWKYGTCKERGNKDFWSNWKAVSTVRWKKREGKGSSVGGRDNLKTSVSIKEHLCYILVRVLWTLSVIYIYAIIFSLLSNLFSLVSFITRFSLPFFVFFAFSSIFSHFYFIL